MFVLLYVLFVLLLCCYHYCLLRIILYINNFILDAFKMPCSKSCFYTFRCIITCINLGEYLQDHRLIWYRAISVIPSIANRDHIKNKSSSLLFVDVVSHYLPMFKCIAMFIQSFTHLYDKYMYNINWLRKKYKCEYELIEK